MSALNLGTYANEKALICDPINASAREIIGNNCRDHPRRAPALFRGFNDIDDGTISRSAIIVVMRLSLFSDREQVGISLNLHSVTCRNCYRSIFRLLIFSKSFRKYDSK